MKTRTHAHVDLFDLFRVTCVVQNFKSLVLRIMGKSILGENQLWESGAPQI